jgi:hypothetical protein
VRSFLSRIVSRLIRASSRRFDAVACYKVILGKAPSNDRVSSNQIGTTSARSDAIRSLVDSEARKEKVNCAEIHQQSPNDRIAMTVCCKDAEGIPKVSEAGQFLERDGQRLQRMHEGSLVVAGGYHGEWMSQVIKQLRGHHEPQEELLFHEILKHVAPGSCIVELGAFWAYYTNWYLGSVEGSRAICVEPDPNNMSCGHLNLALNHRTATWINAAVCSGSKEVLI